MDQFKKITIAIFFVCVLVSGCSLFKKVTKDKFEERQSYELEQVAGSKVNMTDQSVSGSVSSNAVKDNSVRSKFIKADNLVVRPDGSVEASGGVEFHGLDELDVNALSVSEDFNHSNVVYAAEAESRLKAEAASRLKESKSKSEASGKGLLIGSVAVLVVLIGVMWWLGIGRK